MTARVNVEAYLSILNGDLDLVLAANDRRFGDPPCGDGLESRQRCESSTLP